MPKRPRAPLVKAPFDLAANGDLRGKDFSGSDVNRVTLKESNLFESIFNGCDLRHLEAAQCIFQHTEFTEASISDSVFVDTSFDHSDFVLSRVHRCRFIRCTFQNAEWRDTVFSDVRFQQCIFRNTTTSLCRFSRCNFDKTSATSFVGPSKRFSIFTETAFELRSEQVDFLRVNFGLIQSSPEGASPPAADDPLFAASIDFYLNRFTTERFLRAALTEFAHLSTAESPRSQLRLKYLVEVCKAIVDSGRLSVFALQYLHTRLNALLLATASRSVLFELIALVLALRMSVQERLDVIAADVAALTIGKSPWARCELLFVRDYDRGAIIGFAHLLADFCKIERARLQILTVRRNSTFVDLSITAITNIPQLVKALRYSLSDVQIALEKTRSLVSTSASTIEGHLQQGSPTGGTGGSSLSSTLENTALVRRGSGTRAPAKRRATKARKAAAKEFLEGPSGEAREIEVFVNSSKESVLIVEGDVRLRISFG